MSKFAFLQIGDVDSIAEARANLEGLHTNLLYRVFGNDILMLSEKSIRFYYQAASEILLKGGIIAYRRQICEHIVKVYVEEKFSGKTSRRPPEVSHPKKTQSLFLELQHTLSISAAYRLFRKKEK